MDRPPFEIKQDFNFNAEIPDSFFDRAITLAAHKAQGLLFMAFLYAVAFVSFLCLLVK